MAEPRPPFCFLFLYGPPAAGKLTIARLLSEKTGFPVMHNHLTLDPVLALFEFGTPECFRLVGTIRNEMVREAARSKLPGLIFTFCFAAGGDEPTVFGYEQIVQDAGGRVCYVQVVADRDTLAARVGESSRKHFKKISDAGTLDQTLEQHELFSTVPGRQSLTIDTAKESPSSAAAMIIKHFGLDEP